ncbi:MAG: TrkA family potassium uptake protein [Lachnospiraceae bacterium]|jgi:trk system potassium uptake protein TrkA|nr:TrkA family potassium uptake protein [Lachnospiraceae bacterium]
MRNILLIGLGRFGQRIAVRLGEMHIQIMAVDRNEDMVQKITPYVTNAVIGDSTDEEFLKTLGVANFDACIVAIGDDFLSSLEITASLKEMGAAKVISRASNDMQAKFLLRNGADAVVNPEKQMADWMALRYGCENIFDFLELEDGYAIFDVAVPKEWIGRTIGAIDIRRKHDVSIVAVRENGHMDMAISSDFTFAAGQTLLVLGKTKDIQKCFHVVS